MQNLLTIRFLYLSVILFPGQMLYAQEKIEKELESTITNVTVFIQNAQITRATSSYLNPGRYILKFNDLSPYIDPKSIRFKAEGESTIISVNHQFDFENKKQKNAEIEALQKQLDQLDDQINENHALKSVLSEELSFLNENKKIGGSQTGISIENLKASSVFYNSSVKEIKLRELEINKKLDELIKEQRNIQNQIKNIQTKKDDPPSTIHVELDVTKSIKLNGELNYVVKNVGWNPSYTVRSSSLDKPVELVYNAGVYQNTQNNWKNVSLSLSTGEPNLSGVAPKIKPYYLNYNTLPPTYSKQSNEIRGKVYDRETGEALPGATVTVEGTTIGVVTDINGQYSLTLPANDQLIRYSYIGYISEVVPANQSVINIGLQPDIQELDEVVVMGYGTQKKASLKGATREREVSFYTEDRFAPLAAEAPTVEIAKTNTTTEFDIEQKYTINSDGKSYNVQIARYEIPASYEYFTIPKIDNDAFLLAKITGFEPYHLLDGEATLFFEDTYIGKTILNPAAANDTMSISFGRDKNILVKREQLKDFTEKKFIGGKKIETKAWEILVKNKKSYPVTVNISDQIPVSTIEEIEIELEEKSNGNLNTDTGIITWKVDLKPGEEILLKLIYSVKYPKNRQLYLE